MRILVNTRFLLKGKLEGIGHYTYEVLSRIVKTHPEHHFIFCFDRPFDKRFVFARNVEGIVVNPPARHPLLFIWWFEVAIPRVYRLKKADLFLSPDGFCSLSKRIDRQVLVIHDLAFLHYPDQIGWTMLWYYRKFTPMFLEKADAIVTVSKASKKDIASFCPNAANKTTVIYNGTRDLPVLDNLKRRDVQAQFAKGESFFLSVGAIHPRKNVPGLIRAFNSFKDRSKSSTKLLIAGRKAWKTSETKKAHDNSPYASDILFLDYVSDEVLFQLIGASLALVYISLFEGFGLPIVDSMRAGTPVITSNRSSMSEIGGEASILVDPEDADSVASAMLDIYTSPGLVNSLIKKGLEHSKQFSWVESANKLYDVMMALL